MKNLNLNRAFLNRNDEFYTKKETVEEMMSMLDIEEIKQNAPVFLPFDGPQSCFIEYMKNHKIAFEARGYYENTAYATTEHESVIIENYDGIEEIKKHDGELIITNPPFSKLRKIFSEILKYNMKYALIAPLTSVVYKIIFPEILKGNAKIACLRNTSYTTPDGEEKKVLSCLLTNLAINRPVIPLTGSLPAKQEHFDGTHIINFDRYKQIPPEFQGVCGVPLSFLYQYDPDEWEILDVVQLKIKGKAKFRRLLVKRKH